MKKKILQTIEQHNLIEKGMHIVIGLSGGPDSVCLFDVLRGLADEYQLCLHAVHINHKLRPVAAEEDQNYVENLCKNYGIACHTFVEDCNELAKKEGLTSEEAGRKVRYAAFGEVAQRIHKDGIPKDKIAIALAHNANDQCETILFRIMRGTGTDGLAGIPYKRFDENGFAIIRPILDLKREEIEEYCDYRNLEPRIDHTNNENIYARNRIRNMLIPYLADNYNDNIIDTINRLGKIASDDRDYMRAEAEKAYKEALINDAFHKKTLDRNLLSGLHKAIRFRVYTIALEKIGMEQNITFAQGMNIDKILLSESPSAMCDLTDGYVALREYDRLAFQSGSLKKNAGEYNIKTMTKEEFDEYKKKNCSVAGSKLVYGAFCGVNPKDLCVRTRKPGDKINTGNGTKKIQDFFVDQKVPKHSRDSILLLAKGSDVLWVIPSEEFPSENMRHKGRFSADYKVTDNEDDLVIVLEKLCSI